MNLQSRSPLQSSRIINSSVDGQPKTLFLAIDFGSQSVRALLIDCDGCIVEKQQLTNLQYIKTSPKYVEQQADWFYRQVTIVCQNLLKKAQADNIDLRSITAIGITTMRNTLINLDQHGEPLRNAIVWSDTRTAKSLPKLAWYWRAIFTIASIVKPITSTIKELQSKAFINYIAEQEPKVWQQTQHLLLLSGYLSFRLTGKLVDSSANVISHLPFNFKQGKWRNRFSWQYQALAVKPNWLPTLVKPATVIGNLTDNTAKDLGLASTLPLVATAADKSCEILGSGCYLAGQLHISLGTAVSVNMLSAKYKGPKPLYPAYPSLVDGIYLTEKMLNHGMILLNEFIKVNAAGLGFLSLNKPDTISIEHLIELYIIANNIHCDDVVFNLNTLDRAEQVMSGFSGEHIGNVFSQYLAIIDAIVLQIAHAIKELNRRLHTIPSQVIVSGGGANSTLILKKIANITKLPVIKPSTDEAGALGVAITIAVATNVYPNWSEAINAMCSNTNTIAPDVLS
ncbi:FGGY family carbohydrate kinase [Colwelliaceae bacterium BS250]